ncbi:MAG TPA: hypothetical protein DCL15_09860, partial [Chloroflexi bacterium]|nr:hypothetical protein [Chloroflexota bacterium]
SGYMQWGFMPVNGDIGDGDDDSGMDRKWHGGHFDALFNLYRERAAALQTQADAITPAPPPKPAPPDNPIDFRPGDIVFAQAAVRVRRSPGFVDKAESDTLTALTPGQAATVIGTSAIRDGLTWWPVRVTTAEGALIEGWAAQATAAVVLLASVLPAALPAMTPLTWLG